MSSGGASIDSTARVHPQATIGRDVTVSLPGAASLTGRASDIDDDGRLVVATPTGPRALAAGDVAHVRSAITA